MTKYLYKYYPIEDYSLTNLEKEEICFNSMSCFNDLCEGVFTVKTRKPDLELAISASDMVGEAYSEQIRFRFRVLSLTTRYDKRYMWDEYAQHGAGFCIEYNYEDIKSISHYLGEVEYCNDDEPNAYLEDNMDLTKLYREIFKKLYTKTEEWKNEFEVRAVHVIPITEYKKIDVAEYIKCFCDQNSEWQFLYDHYTKQHYKSQKRILKRCIPNKIIIGPNIDERSEKQIRSIALNRQYECEKIDKINLE